MDTFLVTSEFDVAEVSSGLKKARAFLNGFSLYELRDEDYERSVAQALRNWQDFVEAGLTEPVASLIGRPYPWRRFSADIEIEAQRYDIEFFVFPVSVSTAAASIRFSRTLYDALYGFKPSYESEIDVRVKRELVAICLMVADSFSASAFALRPVTEPEDMAVPLQAEDVRHWFMEPTHDLIRRHRYLLAGAQSKLVDLRQAERQWPAERLAQSSSGFVIYDGID